MQWTCIVDWVAAAAWAQVLVLLIAAWIAVRQLGRYNAIETYKQTQELLREYNAPAVQEAWKRLVFQRAIVEDKGLDYPNPTKDDMGRMVHLALFFHHADDVYYRGLVDREAYMHMLAAPTVQSWIVTAALRREYETLRKRSFRRLAKDAYKWMQGVGLSTEDFKAISFD
jgi:hypothetical protein